MAKITRLRGKLGDKVTSLHGIGKKISVPPGVRDKLTIPSSVREKITIPPAVRDKIATVPSSVRDKITAARAAETEPVPVFDLAGYLGQPAPPALPKQRLRSTVKDRPAREPVAPARGYARGLSGRAPRIPVMPVHRGSTAQVQGLYPWLYGGAMPPVGAYLGTDCLTGGAFSCHPVEWLFRGLVTNPNLLITGVPGAGKSATIKALMLRLMAYGVKTFVAGDIKNEYAALARALGVDPVELGPGLRARLNPLDAGPLGRNLPADPELLRERLDEVHRRRITLLSTLISMRLGRKLTPTEEAALSLAIRHASGEATGNTVLADPTIPQVHALLHDPLPGMAADLRVGGQSVQRLREMIRPAVDALGTMTAASLSGLFDGPTTVALDWNAPIQTVDLSRIDKRADDTLAMTLACVSSWGQAAVDEPGGPVRMIVRDELWRAMQVPALVRKIDSDLRLSRAHGTIQLLATHRLADFEAVGAAGSEEVAIARNLIASCDVRVVLRQDTAPLAMTRDEIGLTDTECEHIASWSPAMLGRAIWKIGTGRSCIVQVVLTPAEKRLFWTNQALSRKPERPPGSTGQDQDGGADQE